MNQARLQWWVVGILCLVGVLAIIKKELAPETTSESVQQTVSDLPAEPEVQQSENLTVQQDKPVSKVEEQAPVAPPLIEFAKQDSKEMAKFFEKGATPSALPKNLTEAFKQSEKRRAASFATQESAKNELKNLEVCVSQPAPDYGSTAQQAPAAVKAQIGKLGDMANAECVKWGRQLVDKYPSLRSEFEKSVLKKASPNVLKLAGESAP